MEQLGKEKELVVQLAELEIDPNQLNAYLELLEEGIRASVRTEPRVLSRYAMSDKEQPNKITVVEIYANQEAYSAHRICSEKLVVSSSNTFATMNSKRHRVDRLGTQH